MDDREKPGDFAWKIKNARRYALPAMRQEDLANAIRVSRALVGMWESRERTPVPEVLVKIAKATGVDPDWFFDGKPSPPTRRLSERMQAFSERLDIQRASEQPTLGNSLRPGWIKIPIFGPPSPVPNRPGSGRVPIDWLEVPSWEGEASRWAIRVSGPAMEPDFEIGDLVIFEDRRAEQGLAVFAEKPDEYVFLALAMDGAREVLVPTNGVATPIEAEDWEVKGVAIATIRDLGRGVTVETRYATGCRPRFSS